MTKSLAVLLEEIANADAPLPAHELHRLSDLAAPSAAALAETWPRIELLRRRKIMRRLAEICQHNFEVDFGPIALLGIQDSDSLVRLAAIDTLWDAEDPALIAPLLDLMQNDPELTVQASAARALGQFVLLGELGQLPQPTFARLTRVLSATVQDKNQATLIRCQALESVAAADLEEVPPFIHDAYHSEEEAFQISAVAAMGRTADDSWQAIVLEELDNLNPSMRYHAARAAGQLELAESVPQLIDLLDDPDLGVMRASIWSLGEIGGTAAREALEPLLDDEELGEWVEEAIGMIDLAAGMPAIRFHDWDHGR